MGEITFNKHVQLYDFVLGNDNIDISDNNTKKANAVIYKADNVYIERVSYLQAVYKSETLQSDAFAIYRKKIQDDQLTYLGTLKNLKNGFMDYNINSNSMYKYILHTNPQNGSNASIETQYITVRWNKWSIVSLNYDFDNDVYVPDDTVFLFSNNLNVGSFSDNLNIMKFDTLSRYGKVIQGDQQYDSGSLSCLFGDFMAVQTIQGNKFVVKDESNLQQIQEFLGAKNQTRIMSVLDQNLRQLYCAEKYKDISNLTYVYLKYFDEYYIKENNQWSLVPTKYQYSNDNEKLKQWKTFVQDHKIKLLKSPQGESWIVAISNATSRDVKYESHSYPTTIGFDWQEVMDKDKITIVSWSW